MTKPNDRLQDSLCKVFDHDWDYTGSGEAKRPRCSRCDKDYIEWMYREVATKINKVIDLNMNKTYPTLYKQTSKGKIQQWTISVSKATVTTIYGLVDGKLQTTIDIVKEGKNIGRSNETTPATQAEAETLSSYEGKLKEGYVEDAKLAASTKNTLGAVEPMLAHPIENKLKYVKFPALAQPKLDGARCLAIMIDGTVTLWSRTQKKYLSTPHLIEEIEKTFGRYKNLILDGELYNHAYKHDFNTIMSLIKREDVHENHELVQFHIYDVVGEGNWTKRTSILSKLDLAPKNGVAEIAAKLRNNYCFRVETIDVKSQDGLEEYQADCVERGYEGCMYRAMDGLYEHKRSSGLLKVKDFKDDEFKIVDVEEGSGKLMGRVGAFYCELPDGRTFKAKPMGTLDHVKDLWKNKKDCIGKMATVKYQNLTPDGVPRFPVLKGIRDYE